MRILFCTNSYEKITNGPAKFAKNLIPYTNNFSDIECYILTEDIKKENNFEFKININLPKRLRYLTQFFRMVLYMRRAIKLDKIFNFDFIVYNNAFNGSIHSIFSKKVIGMINDENNIIKAFNGENFIKFPTKHFIFQIFEKIAVKNMSLIIVNSHYLKKVIDNSYNIFNTFVLNKGIENSLVNQFNFNLINNKQKKTIAFIKSDYKRGGLDVLINALELIEFDFHLTIVGVPKLVQKQKYTLNGFNIEWIERLDQHGVFDLLRTSELFCSPAYSEAFGVANLEAVAKGCKIVSTNVGGIPEALHGFKNVILIEPHSHIKLAQAINDSFKNKFIPDAKIKQKLKILSYEQVYSNFINILKKHSIN
jgi:colanic acid/amylovoran biosynthesis glycosyltransferase